MFSLSESHSVVSDFCDPIDYTVHGIPQARILELPFPFPGDLPNPGIEPRSPTLQADSLPAEPQGKPFNEHKNGHYVMTIVYASNSDSTKEN